MRNRRGEKVAVRGAGPRRRWWTSGAPENPGSRESSAALSQVWHGRGDTWWRGEAPRLGISRTRILLEAGVILYLKLVQ